MTLKEKCIVELISHDLFLSSLHYSRFVEEADILEVFPFFNKEILKCAFIASWVDEYSSLYLKGVQLLIDANSTDLGLLVDYTRELSKNAPTSDKPIFDFALEILEHPGQTPSDAVLMTAPALWIPLLDNALEVSRILDTIPADGWEVPQPNSHKKAVDVSVEILPGGIEKKDTVLEEIT